MTNDQTDEAFQALHEAQRSAQLLFMDLRDAGDATNAAGAQFRADRLQNEIDNLINKKLTDWQEDSADLIKPLADAASAAQKAAAEVEDDVKNAQKVVSAMQLLDNVVGVAIKFIG